MNNIREVIMYIIVGIITTGINILSYAFFIKTYNVNYIISTTLAWVLSVLFSFIASKRYVFKSVDNSFKAIFKELNSFVFFRFISYFLDVGLMILLIEIIDLNGLLSKVITNALVIILNYFASKFIIFKKAN